jgi:hypothetical protein
MTFTVYDRLWLVPVGDTEAHAWPGNGPENLSSACGEYVDAVPYGTDLGVAQEASTQVCAACVDAGVAAGSAS